MSGLFNGQPLPQQPTGSDTSSSYPLWLQQYVYNLANTAGNLAGSDYSQFPGQQVAAPSNVTMNAWNMAQGNVGNYEGALGQAYNNTATGAQGTNVGQLTGGDISRYMNPYTDSVVGALQTASNKNFAENQLPMIASQFVKSGQSRSPQERQADNQALYNQNMALNQATAGALQQGYQGALTTAGQQQAMTLQQQQANRQAAQQAGAQWGALGQLTQQLGGYDVGQVAAAGQGIDTNNQANINSAMNNFYAQQQWPYQQLAYASNIVRGQPVATNTQVVGQSPASQNSYSPSPLSSFIGTTLGASAIAHGATGRTNGTTGSLFGYRGGGRVTANDNRRRGALSLVA